MVKIMENPIKMDDLEENSLFSETPLCYPPWFREGTFYQNPNKFMIHGMEQII